MAGAFENFPYTNFHDLNLDWIIKIIREVNETYPDLIDELMRVKINKPTDSPDGQLGDYLISNGDGTTQWKKLDDDIEEQIINAVNEWLEEHPEATTTVVDHSITPIKFEEDLENRLNILPKTALSVEFLGRIIRPNPYRSAQGFAVTTENGTDYLYTCMYNYNVENEKSVIIKMTADGTIVATSDEYAMSHSNDMCFDGTYIYVTGYNTNEIYRLTTNLVLVETITVPVNIQALTWDDENEIFYAYNTYPNPFIYTISPDFSTYASFCPYTPAYGVETIEYTNNMLLITENAPNSITAISTKTKEIIGIIPVNEYMSNYYPIGEMQSICVKENGDFYLLGKPRVYDPVTDNYEIGAGTATYGRGNLYEGTKFQARYQNVAQETFTGTATVNPNNFVFKPIGSADAPFYSAGDVSLCLQSPYFTPIQFNILGTLTDTMAIPNRTGIYITGGTFTINAFNSDVVLQGCNIGTESQFINSNVLCRNCTGEPTLNNSRFYSNTYMTVTNSQNRSQVAYPRYKNLGTVEGANNYEETLTFDHTLPQYLLVTKLVSGVFSETQMIPYSGVNDAYLESESYRVYVLSTSITVRVKTETTSKVRVYLVY